MANAKATKEEAPAKDEEGGVRVRPNLEKYVKGVSGSGKKTLRTNDPVANALDGFTLDEVYGVAARMTEQKVSDLQAKYGHLNVGMQRMNLGNRIRGAIAKQDKLHEADNKVASGQKLLEIECEKPRAAADKRADAAAKEKADREAKAAAKAAEKSEDKPAASKKKGKKKSA